MGRGYHDLVWVQDEYGGTYACFADDMEAAKLDSLLLFNIEEHSRCLDIKGLVENKHR